jgi:hypothetical protein
MTTSLPSRVTVLPQVLSQDLDDESVLLNLQTERYHSLNDVGTRMWKLLSEYGDTAIVMARLVDEYEVDEGTLRHDLAALIRELTEACLVSTEG